jgi:hypothetical protein
MLGQVRGGFIMLGHFIADYDRIGQVHVKACFAMLAY